MLFWCPHFFCFLTLSFSEKRTEIEVSSCLSPFAEFRVHTNILQASDMNIALVISIVHPWVMTLGECIAGIHLETALFAL